MKKMFALIMALSLLSGTVTVTAREIERKPDGTIKYSHNDVVLMKYDGDKEKITLVGGPLEIVKTEPDEKTLKSDITKKYWVDCEEPYLIYFDMNKNEIIKEDFELKILDIWDYNVNKVFDYETGEELGYIDPSKGDVAPVKPTQKDELSSEGKITDLNEICKILTEYAAEYFPKARVYIRDEKEVTFNTNATYSSVTSKQIRDFIDKSNIYSPLVGIAVMNPAPVMDNDLVPVILLGDLNSDGKADITDLSELSLALVGDKELTESQQKAADVDSDGAVKLADLAKFRQYLSKVISSLG